MKKYVEPPKPKYNVGDRVHIEGYGGKEFEITSIHLNYERNSEQEFYDLHYECFSYEDSEYYFADETDISPISEGGGGAAVAVADKPSSHDDKPAEIDSANISEQIDELLAELSDVMTLIEMFGEHEDEGKRDRRYILRKNEIEAKLIELMRKQNEGEIPS